MSASDASRARTRSPRVKSRSPSATAWTLGGAAKTTATTTTAHHHESVPIRESKRFEVPSETLMKRMGGPSDGKAGLSGGFRTEEEINQILYEGSKGTSSSLSGPQPSHAHYADARYSSRLEVS